MNMNYSNGPRIEKLNKENYNIWKLHIALLIKNYAWDYVSRNIFKHTVPNDDSRN